MAYDIKLTTTGLLSPVVIDDFGEKKFAHPTVDYSLIPEFTFEEVQASTDLQAHVDAGNVTLTDSGGNSITDVSQSSNEHEHAASDVTDFDTEVSNNVDVAANTAAQHSHTNKTELDLVTDGDHDVRTDNPHGTAISNLGTGTIAELNTAITDATLDGHSHSNKAQLDLVSDGDHDVRTDNPHGVTAAQTGADPSGTINYTHPNHTGDVTSVADGAQTIAANAVTNTKAADMPTLTIKGNNTGGTADPKDLTVAEAQSLLGITAGVAGLAISTINGQAVLTLEDTTRASKKLSVSEMSVMFAEGTVGDDDWLAVGIVLDADAGYIMPLNATIVGISVWCDNDNSSAKELDLYIDAALDSTIYTFPGGGNEVKASDMTLNIDVAQNSKIRVRAGTTGGNIQDTVVQLHIKWRAA